MRLLASTAATLALLAPGCRVSHQVDPTHDVRESLSEATSAAHGQEHKVDCEPQAEEPPKAVLLEGFDLGADDSPADIAASCEKRTGDFLSECQEIRIWLGDRSIRPEAKLGLTGSADLSITVLKPAVPSSPFFVSGSRMGGNPWHLLVRPEGDELHALWESPSDNRTWTLEPSEDTWKIQRIKCNREAQPDRCETLGEDYDEGDDLWTDPHARFTDETLRWSGSTVEQQTESRIAPFAECDCET